MKLAVLLFAGLISCTTTMSAKKHDTTKSMEIINMLLLFMTLKK